MSIDIVLAGLQQLREKLEDKLFKLLKDRPPLVISMEGEDELRKDIRYLDRIEELFKEYFK